MVGTVLLLAALAHLARGLDLALVGAALAALPRARVVVAIGLTGASYLLLTLYDGLALASLGEKVPPQVVARASFTAYALSHNLGFGALTGGSARLAIYGPAGLSPAGVGRVILLASAAFWCGIAVVSAGALLLHGQTLVLFGVTLTTTSARLAGAAVIALLALVPLAARLEWPLRSARSIAPGLLAALLAVACADIALSALALLVLVPSLGPADFPQLLLAYALAIAAGAISHVPGGVGVFEGTVLAGLGRHDPQLAAALIAYRAIYYLLPLGLSLTLNGLIALRATCRRNGPVGQAIGAIAIEAAPLSMAAMVFAGGLVLLLSGVLPGEHDRLSALREHVPLPLVEAAHLAGSLTGAALLLVAPALLSRSRSGLSAARALLLFGALCSLGKGLDFEEAALMLAMAGALHGLAPAFYRESLGAFSSHNRRWLLAAVAAVILAAASGLAAYPHVPLASWTWLHFGWRADIARYMRASSATCLLVAFFAVRELLSRPPVQVGRAALPRGVYSRATADSGRSDAMLALTGDKRFLVSAGNDAFLMFRPVGRTWFVMGDPVGSPERWSELAWELRLQSDRVGARLCFYQISDAFLPLALELGLNPVKYGEEAVIAAETFSLAGPLRKGLRNSHARARREGLTLQLVLASGLREYLPELRAISDAWLAHHGGREKRFSLGAFDQTYLLACDAAIVRRADGTALAFANLWRSGDGAELSVDLMRHSPDAPGGTMDYLLAELIMVAQRHGFARFNLGVAPLSGMREGRLATRWTRAARLAFGFRQGRYNFRGLRRYKEKFAPTWQNRYIAIPSGLAGYRALLQLLRLVGG